MRRRVWVAKDSPRITAGELQRLVESWGQKPKNKYIKHPLYHHMLFGRVSRKIIFTHPKTNSGIFSCQTQLELQTALASMVRWNLKKESFLAANPPDEFSTNRDKKVPHVHGEIYCWIFNVVGLFFCWRSWTSCLDTWHHGFYQIPTDKKSKHDCLC